MTKVYILQDALLGAFLPFKNSLLAKTRVSRIKLLSQSLLESTSYLPISLEEAV